MKRTLSALALSALLALHSPADTRQPCDPTVYADGRPAPCLTIGQELAL